MWNYNNFIYILTSKNNTVLYTGVTTNIKQRVYQHKTKKYQGFTNKYNVDKLVYYERFDHIEEAIKREKQIKGWLRKRKEELINSINPKWDDLFENLV
jgi:putative endonuclease